MEKFVQGNTCHHRRRLIGLIALFLCLSNRLRSRPETISFKTFPIELYVTSLDMFRGCLEVSFVLFTLASLDERYRGDRAAACAALEGFSAHSIMLLEAMFECGNYAALSERAAAGGARVLWVPQRQQLLSWHRSQCLNTAGCTGLGQVVAHGAGLATVCACHC